MLILITRGLGLNPWFHMHNFTYNTYDGYLYEHSHSLLLRPVIKGDQRFMGALTLPLRTFRGRGWRHNQGWALQPTTLGQPPKISFRLERKLMPIPPDFEKKLLLYCWRLLFPQNPISNVPHSQDPKSNIYVHFHLVNKHSTYISFLKCETVNEACTQLWKFKI